jgi:adenylylsulfate kinase-like enzyme
LRSAVLGWGVGDIGARMPWTSTDVGGAVVVVLAGHAGAGASTVALAIAEALVDHRRVQLVEYADPIRSGLAAASSVELGAQVGWRREPGASPAL